MEVGADDDDDVAHITETDNDDRAMCGVDLTGDEWVPEGYNGPWCPTCEAMMSLWDAAAG